MEFITGLKQQEEAELEDLLKAEEGTAIILEGAVHSVRDMGEIAFVILRKRKCVEISAKTVIGGGYT